MYIAQLSDLHYVPPPGLLYGRVDTAAALETALARLAALQPRPDLLLISGDLVDRGSPAEYRSLAAQLATTGIPLALLPGNHDHRQHLQAAFPDQAWSGPRCHQRRELTGGTLLLLDSLVPGHEYGEITPDTLAWLDASCPTDRRVLLALHHPPFPVGIPGMDAINCRGAALLESWLNRHPQVEAVLCGHVHRFISTRFADRPALTAPSPAHQIALDLQGPPGDLAYTLEPGGLLLHLWAPGRSLISHYLPCTPAPVQRYRDL
ncbi:hypothetical protein AZSI13_15460 [Azospira sp. I13]|uniref:phosphodiesterase n=1 Tax=Azospira sp. I13 TaxID=1765050 RepID=UPI000D4AA369|nr:phosphodiesterase [Azospira sp. I13]GBG02219.1 hypothetical protein AZSI13_15460 [Azospira sp. I13]